MTKRKVKHRIKKLEERLELIDHRLSLRPGEFRFASYARLRSERKHIEEELIRLRHAL